MMAASFVALVEVMDGDLGAPDLENSATICLHYPVSVVQSTGTFIAVSRYASATPLPPSVLSRGIGWQVMMMTMISEAPYRSILAVRKYPEERLSFFFAGHCDLA